MQMEGMYIFAGGNTKTHMAGEWTDPSPLKITAQTKEAPSPGVREGGNEAIDGFLLKLI